MLDAFKRAVIFANGDVSGDLPMALRDNDYLIAADGGVRHLLRRGIIPHLLVGDLDSIADRDLTFLRQKNVEMRVFPKDKDETDLELALREALRRGFKDIVLTGVMGPLPDYILGNLMILGLPDIGDAHVSVEDGLTRVYLVKKDIELDARVGDRVSLVPWSGPASGIVTEGLRYPLKGETLHPWETRGISNVAERSPFRVSLAGGALFLFHVASPSRDEP